MAVGLPPRDYVIEEYTTSLCPACFAERPRRADEPGTFVDAMLIRRNNKIYLRRYCPTHGPTESLYEENADIWKKRDGWATPTLAITPDRPDNFAGFPDGYRHGLPASHGQHTCILLLNVTSHCNFRCPTCFAEALDPGTPIPQPLRPSLEEINHTVDTMIERENGRLGVLMLSGGEPTVRKDIEQIIDLLMSKPITRIMLNTNGRRIAKDDNFLKFLEERNTKVEIYLQHDGPDVDAHMHLRGENLIEEKALILRRLSQADVLTTLVMTAKLGVNDDDIGALAQIALDAPCCSGIAIQPVFGSGRTSDIDPMNRLTPTGAIERLEKQSRGLIKATDFIPLPCSHKDCCDIAYLIQDKQGNWKSLVDLVGRDELHRWIHLAANTISFESVSDTVKEMVKDGVLQRLFSEQNKPSSLKVAADLFKLCGCIPGVHEAISLISSKSENREKQLRELSKKTFRITTKMFMDVNTFHEARIRQCCVHVGSFEPDPRRYSFCWRWIFDDAEEFPHFEHLEDHRIL